MLILTVPIQREDDIVEVRRYAREIAELLSFPPQDQTRIATAVSEISRNALQYAAGGVAEFSVEGETQPQRMSVRISDSGPGIAQLQRVLDGSYRSNTGMGLGIIGARRLMDQCDIRSGAEGTTVTLKKLLPRGTPPVVPESLARISDALRRVRKQNPLEEVKHQNCELVRALEELRKRQDELSTLNRELEDTNRGVVALYAELDEKADHLRRADELKSRFLSNMSHEFRTPLNSILALTSLLQRHLDGALSVEQERQVQYIRKSAESLLELVNDLLDIAKVEAGKIVVHPAEFELARLFGALRGMLRPLLVSESINLVFEEPEGIPPLYSDEGKISQILRNLISYALKFTERGEVRVSAVLAPGGSAVVLGVSDTGIGIAPEDHERIFQEFTQIDHPAQHRAKGTGLGLPLSRKLAELLGGKIEVDSTPGSGSTFQVTIPLHYASSGKPESGTVLWSADPKLIPILVVEDRDEDFLVVRKLLGDTEFQPLHARNLREAQLAIKQVAPRAIILDVLLDNEDTWAFLGQLKSAAKTRDIPITVLTVVADPGRARALGADAFLVKPAEKESLLETLRNLTRVAGKPSILLIDDDETSRYVLKSSLQHTRYRMFEASNGADGLRIAQELRPSLILLDLVMPGLSGFEVLDLLRQSESTRGIPVVIVTGNPLTPGQKEALLKKGVATMAKNEVGEASMTLTVQQAMMRPSDLTLESRRTNQ